LYELASRFNSFYNQQPILKAKKADELALRLNLTAATQRILSQGLRLLGIETPEEM
jgi:arginyl-tRNA synthetase